MAKRGSLRTRIGLRLRVQPFICVSVVVVVAFFILTQKQNN